MVAKEPLRTGNAWSTDAQGTQRMYVVWWVERFDGVQKNVYSNLFRRIRVFPWKEGLDVATAPAASSSGAAAPPSQSGPYHCGPYGGPIWRTRNPVPN